MNYHIISNTTVIQTSFPFFFSLCTYVLFMSFNSALMTQFPCFSPENREDAVCNHVGEILQSRQWTTMFNSIHNLNMSLLIPVKMAVTRVDLYCVKQHIAPNVLFLTTPVMAQFNVPKCKDFTESLFLDRQLTCAGTPWYVLAQGVQNFFKWGTDLTTSKYLRLGHSMPKFYS